MMPQPDQHSKIGKDTTRSTTQKHRKQRIQRPPFHKSLKQLQRNTDQRRSDHIIKIPAKKNRKRPGDHRIDQNLRPKRISLFIPDHIQPPLNLLRLRSKLTDKSGKLIQIIQPPQIIRHPRHPPRLRTNPEILTINRRHNTGSNGKNIRPGSTISQADTTARLLTTPNLCTTAKKLLPNRHRIIQILLRLIPRHPAPPCTTISSPSILGQLNIKSNQVPHV